MIIKEVTAKAIKDSRGERTIEVSVNKCKASSPSGKSTGKYEARPYHQSLEWCIDFLKNWDEKIEINSFKDLRKVEEAIMAKGKFAKAQDFGGNALFAFESAILKALAKSQKKELWEVVNSESRQMPVPVGNAVGGGMHSAKFANHPVFQEFHIIPEGEGIQGQIEFMNNAYERIGRLLEAKKKNDEGAWQTERDEGAILDIMQNCASGCLGLDIAASTFYSGDKYKYRALMLRREQQISYIIGLIEKYNLKYVEDPLHEEDFEGFAQLPKETMIVGDDLTATQKDRTQRAINEGAINAMIVKPNQNGSLLEVKEICDLCRKHGVKIILSHRSGETKDTALADYAVGFEADFIKTGISTQWREGKLKRLLQIREQWAEKSGKTS